MWPRSIQMILPTLHQGLQSTAQWVNFWVGSPGEEVEERRTTGNSTEDIECCLKKFGEKSSPTEIEKEERLVATISGIETSTAEETLEEEVAVQASVGESEADAREVLEGVTIEEVAVGKVEPEPEMRAEQELDKEPFTPNTSFTHTTEAKLCSKEESLRSLLQVMVRPDPSQEAQEDLSAGFPWDRGKDHDGRNIRADKGRQQSPRSESDVEIGTKVQGLTHTPDDTAGPESFGSALALEIYHNHPCGATGKPLLS